MPRPLLLPLRDPIPSSPWSGDPALMPGLRIVPQGSYQPYATAVRAHSPLVYYRLDEASGTTAVDAMGVYNLTYTGSPTLGAAGLLASEPDTAVRFVRASTQYARRTTAGMPAGSATGVTLEAWINLSSLVVGEYHSLISWGNESATVNFAEYTFRAADVTVPNQWYYTWSDGTALRQSITFLSDVNQRVFVGQTHHHAVVHDYAAETVSFYLDGALLETKDVSAFATPIAIPANQALALATYTGSLGDRLDGTMDEAAIYTSVLPTARVLAHYIAGMSAIQTATPTLAALVATGIAPTVSTSDNQSVSPSVATLVTAGIAPTVTASNHQSVSPSVASLTLTGIPPSVAVGIVATPTVASLTLTGVAPTVTATDHKSVSPSVAALTVTGIAPSTVLGTVIAPSVASLATTGIAPAVSTSDHQTATPSVASLTVSGIAPTVTASDHQTITPTVAALALTADTPTVTVAGGTVLAEPAPAALTLTGIAPTVIASGAEEGHGSLRVGTARPRRAPVLASPAPAHLRLITHQPDVRVNDDDLVLLLAS